MSSKTHKYTKKELETIAAGIPEYPMVNKNGSPIVFKHVVSYDVVINTPNLLELAKASKLPLKPGAKYCLTADYEPVNHLKRMGKYLKAYGEKGIMMYIDFVGKEYRSYQVWVQENSVAESTPIQSLSQEQIDSMNQEEHSNPHSTSNTEDETTSNI